MSTIIDVSSQLSNINWPKHFNFNSLSIVTTIQDYHELDITSVMSSVVDYVDYRIIRFHLKDADLFSKLIIIDVN